ncbi:N-acetylmuramoyl-L-alanine amidase [Corynebacterium sp. H128]|uniref:N-acetylmuramoyl-L-alanine amidase n=1 Tax=unclassified Corynebacterium TaxID=2624378 RepID=UPI0030A3DF0B
MTELLQVGDKSPRVAEVRATLARLGLLPHHEGELQPGASRQFSQEDMYFDEELASALRAFQQSRGIRADGVICDKLLRLLREASYRLGTRVLIYQPGNVMIGDDVVELQTQLQELGFYAHRIDGHYGEATYNAVMNYQLNYGLNEDGITGPDTIRALGLLGRRITGGSRQAISERERVRQAGPKLAGKRVVIDPHLGGSNKGQVVDGKFGRITEEEILWDLATRVEGRMIAAGMEAILSRPRLSEPDTKQRAEIANAFGADLLINLQCDSYPNERANGVSTFYFGSEIGATSLTGEMLSGYIQREVVARTGLGNCRNHARTWDLLRMTKMPTIELVCGYLTNPGDVEILTDPNNRDAIAEAIIVAVKRLYLLDDDDQPTGTYKFAELLEAEAQ